ncbi:MAG: phosphotransferase [Clostridia bacterium]|nr:phosphotransferase [Clostridia bacterium]MDE7084045.1 phosphotransferase [Clostridia bacterium]MDE7257398.1 phosphotransferase [Clostridia bacterium]
MTAKKFVKEHLGKELFISDSGFVKVFGDTYTKSGILNEALNQARVEETDLNIPKIKAIEVVDGKWSIVMDYIEGTTLSELMRKHPEKEDEYLELFVELQRSVLSKRVPMLNKLKDKMQGRISDAKLDATTRYDLHTRLDSLPKHYNLCHGDFHPSNVIITKDGTPYIIDWAHATQGNASADVAGTYLMFYLEGKEQLAEKYLKLYCLKSDTAKQYVQKWIPIVAASRLTKAKAEEDEFLRRWIDVVDYE